VDSNHIDLGLLGSQKVLSLMSDLSMVSISERAWAAIAEVCYVGYDALAPWQSGVEARYLPYTHNWHAMAGLATSLSMLESEGHAAAYARHRDIAQFCRDRLRGMGLKLWTKDERFAAPTVTAAEVPAGWTWPDFDRAL